MVKRMVRSITPRDDFPALPLFQELLRDKHLLIADHTRRYLKDEIHFPGPAIDRANRSRWQAEGRLSLGARAHAEVESLLDRYEPSRIPDDAKNELAQRMGAEARRFGMDTLPHLATT
jgi:trimethylamine:corrinoid methyltransferase-like protein